MYQSNENPYKTSPLVTFYRLVFKNHVYFKNYYRMYKLANKGDGPWEDYKGIRFHQFIFHCFNYCGVKTEICGCKKNSLIDLLKSILK